MTLNQHMEEIFKWNTPLISRATQVEEQLQKITCYNLGNCRYHLIIQNI